MHAAREVDLISRTLQFCTPNGHELGAESYGIEKRAHGLEREPTLSFSMADDVATALYVAALILLILFSLVSPIP